MKSRFAITLVREAQSLSRGVRVLSSQISIKLPQWEDGAGLHLFKYKREAHTALISLLLHISFPLPYWAGKSEQVFREFTTHSTPVHAGKVTFIRGGGSTTHTPRGHHIIEQTWINDLFDIYIYIYISIINSDNMSRSSIGTRIQVQQECA